MAYLESLFGVIGDLTWGWSLIPILVVLGVFITALTDFVQFRYFKRMFRVLSSKNQSGDPNAISAREALLISVGGRVGGGNIAGVAVAITLGGPGAVFWMWAIALVGMATSLVECSLAQLYKRREPDGAFRGGPARSIIHGLGEDYRWLAVLYAVCLIAAFGIGFNAFQGNTVAGAVQDSLGIERYITGGLLAVVAGFIVFGGIHRIAKAADVVVPIMAVSYILMALVIILMNIGSVPGVLATIFANAFGFEEAVGGGMGAAIAQGLRRGLFSNEAGLGSAPNVAATADVRHPISQGITQSFSVFIDTIFICSCTAFVILLGDVYTPGAESVDGIVLTQQSLVSPSRRMVAISAVADDPALCLQLDHLQLLSRRERADRDHRESDGGAGAARGGDRYRVHRRNRTGSDRGFLLLRPDDGDPRPGEPDRDHDAAADLSSDPSRFRQSAEVGHRAAGFQPGRLSRSGYRSNGLDRQGA